MKKIESKIVGVTVQKGGAGKSTTAEALSYQFAKEGFKTALVDIDPQATLTGAFFGYSYGAFSGNDESNIIRLFKKEKIEPIKKETAKFIDNPNKKNFGESHFIEEEIFIDFYPSNDELLDITENDEMSRQEKIDLLVKFFNSLREQYDRIIIDAPPSLGIITTAVLKASDSLIVPIPTKSVDTDGMVGFFRKADKIYESQKIEKLSKILILPNMYTKNTTDSKETLLNVKSTPTLLQETKNLRKIYCKVLEPMPLRACIQEAPSFRLFLVPYIMDYSRKNLDVVLLLDNIIKELEG